MTLTNEEVLLNSDDSSITLTTHRIIHKTKDVSQEIFLKDLVGHEIVYKKEMTFLIIGIIGGLLLFLFFLKILGEHGGGNIGLAPILLFFVSATFFICYFKFQKKYLKISGRYNSLEFSVKNLSQNSLSDFITKISIWSDKRKIDN